MSEFVRNYTEVKEKVFHTNKATLKLTTRIYPKEKSSPDVNVMLTIGNKVGKKTDWENAINFKIGFNDYLRFQELLNEKEIDLRHKVDGRETYTILNVVQSKQNEELWFLNVAKYNTADKSLVTKVSFPLDKQKIRTIILHLDASFNVIG